MMDNDCSWLGLWKKGVRIECRNFGNKDWMNVNLYKNPQEIIKSVTYQFRYKHRK